MKRHLLPMLLSLYRLPNCFLNSHIPAMFWIASVTLATLLRHSCICITVCTSPKFPAIHQKNFALHQPSPASAQPCTSPALHQKNSSLPCPTLAKPYPAQTRCWRSAVVLSSVPLIDATAQPRYPARLWGCWDYSAAVPCATLGMVGLQCGGTVHDSEEGGTTVPRYRARLWGGWDYSAALPCTALGRVGLQCRATVHNSEERVVAIQSDACIFYVRGVVDEYTEMYIVYINI